MNRRDFVRIAAVSGALLLVPFQADPFTVTPTSCTFAAKYTEPTTTTAGGAVQLTGTVVYYKVNGGTEKSIQVPASSLAGGGAITQNITEPCAPGLKYTITGQATAKNSFGESARTTLTTLVIDRTGEVAPNPPVGGSLE